MFMDTFGNVSTKRTLILFKNGKSELKHMGNPQYFPTYIFINQ